MRPLLPSGPTAAGWLRRAVVVIAAAYLLVLPQFASKASFFGVPGQPGPLAVLTLGLGLWLMPVLLVASWVAQGRVRLPHPLLTVPAGLFVIGAAVSTVVASDKSSALVRAAEMTGLWAGMWALAQALRADGERRFLLAALVAAGVVSAAVAVHQAAIGFPRDYQVFLANREAILARMGIEPGSYVEQMFRERFTGGVQAALGHPNVLAAMLTLALFAAVGLAGEKWFEIRSAGGRALAAVAASASALCAVGIVLTKSRSAVVAVGVGAWWLVVARRVRRRRRRIALLLLPVALGAAALALATQVDHPAVASALTTLRYRLDYWWATLKILARHWDTGVGLENFGHQYVQHKAPWAPEEVADPHNLFLSVWSCLGLAGLMAMGLLWATAVRAWWRRSVPSLSSPLREQRGTAEGQRAPSPRESSADGRTRHLTMAARAENESASAVGLPGLLVPTVAMAGPAVFWFLAHFFGGLDSAEGLAWGMGGVAGMAILAGLLPAESPNRLEASGRPMDRLRTACIVGLLAFALAEQIGTAVLEPPTAWAMLVLLVVTLRGGPRRADPGRAGRGSGRASPSDVARPPAGEDDRDLPVPARRRSVRPVPGRPIGLPARFAVVLAAMAFCFAYTRYLVVPVAQERRMLKEASYSLDTFGVEPTRAAAEANPLAWEPAYLRGHLWHQRAKEAQGPMAAMHLERAVEGYQAALRRHPRLRRAQVAMADAYLAMPGAPPDPRLLAAARAALEGAAGLYPTHIPTRLRLARVIDRLGRPREALAAYQEVLRLDRLMPMAGRRLSEADRAEVTGRLAALRAEPAERPPEAANSP